MDERQKDGHAKALPTDGDTVDAVLGVVSDAVILLDEEGRIVRCNRAAWNLLAMSDAEFDMPLLQRAAARRWFTEAGDPLSIDQLPAVQVLRGSDAILDSVVGVERNEGARRWLSISVRPIDGPNGRRHAVARFTDVTPHRRAQELIANERRLLQEIIDGTPSMIWAFDRTGRVLFANETAAKFLGRSKEALVGVFPPDELPPDVGREIIERNARVISSGKPETTETEVPLPGGPRTVLASRYPLFDSAGQIYGSASITTDITEQKRVEGELRLREAEARKAQTDLEHALEVTHRTEEKFRQAQKMQAVGRLAGGVAHDFNNLLTVILTSSEFLRVQLQKGDPLQSLVEEISHAGQRAADLTRQLLAFSRQQILEPKIVQVNDVIAGAEKMLRRVIGEDIELTLLLSPRVRLCRLDVGQLEQVLMNLVVNSRDAMPDGGRLTIESSEVELSESYVESHPEAARGPHVLISVTDTGEGMSVETRARLFEPFYTTKPAGKGTGLGLATVYGIVKQSSGSVWVYSEPGQGTTFKLYFPIVDAEHADPTAPSLPAVARRPATETVLLVEDDGMVRRSVAAILRRAGYHVIEAGNGGEALLTCEQYGGRIDLMLTDVVMPQMNGRKLAERLRHILPELRVLFMSGYTQDAIVHHGVLESGIDFIAKPITPDQLLGKLRQVLDRT